MAYNSPSVFTSGRQQQTTYEAKGQHVACIYVTASYLTLPRCIQSTPMTCSQASNWSKDQREMITNEKSSTAFRGIKFIFQSKVSSPDLLLFFFMQFVRMNRMQGLVAERDCGWQGLIGQHQERKPCCSTSLSTLSLCHFLCLKFCLEVWSLRRPLLASTVQLSSYANVL